ncbi:MAG: cytochrome-c oxidase, cbb3-type subunit I [Planctomycetota bacterium]|jgi:cytochrome c oxidase cbb3-type subunit I/II
MSAMSADAAGRTPARPGPAESPDAADHHDGASGPIETFRYDDDIARKFAVATVLWGIVGMLVGVYIAVQMVMPSLSFNLEWLTFGRLRPLHTNAVIFAFAGNAIFTAVYHSTQRLCKCRMWSDTLSRVHFWGWQAIIVAAAITLPLGITQSREYAELEWPIDLAITVVWVIFAVNFFMTLKNRRERHIYVAIWFYIASIIAVAVLHVFNNVWVIAGPLKSYSVYSGTQDAFMQWWYGHNAVAFFLTTPFLGLMYYYLPKAAERPVFSYRLSIVHFWSLVFIYIWAGPHHLHYTALPAWASTLGMLFSLMLWMPSWGGMINGLLTLRGAWHRVAADPVLKFLVVGVTFYGMSTFEGPMLSIKAVNSLSHYTDWTIAHVHSGALGWNGMMTFGMLYWLTPRLFQTKLWSKTLMSTHFWIATIGILLYVIPIYVAGITQGLMWRAFDAKGMLAYPDFVETVMQLMPFYWARVIGGTMFLAGAILLAVNMFMTWMARPKTYAVPEHSAPALTGDYRDAPLPPSRLAHAPVADAAHKIDTFLQARWHRRWERLPFRFTVWVFVAVAVASLFEIIPTFALKSNVVKIDTVQPYTPLELIGRDIYVGEGCYNCHSQMIRPIHAETERYGEFSRGGEFVYDHPFQWGSRRIGPDLHRVGGRYSHNWHIRHMIEPASMTKDSIMPNYPHMIRKPIDWSVVQRRVRAMQILGVPYSDEEVAGAEELAREQARAIVQEILEQDGPGAIPGPEECPPGLENVQVIALVAYLQRLGTDIYRTPEPDATESMVASMIELGPATDAEEEVTGDG